MLVPVTMGSKTIGEAVLYSESFENKDKLPLMFPHMTVEERVGAWCDYFAMCGDKREMEADDEFLKFPHVFSFRRDYQSDPLYGLSWDGTKYSPNGTGMSSMSRDDHVVLQCMHSYSGENDSLVLDGVARGVEWLKRDVAETDRKVVRTDLFQIYWSKGTNVRTFMVKEVPLIAEYFLEKIDEVGKTRGRWGIMELATDVYRWMQDNTTQPNMKYSTKDASLDLSLCFSEAIDPESFLEAGTGCRRGLYQIFGETTSNPDRQREMYDEIKSHPKYPLQHNHYSRMEAQVCYGFKFIAHKAKLLDIGGRAKKKHVLLGTYDPACKTHFPLAEPKGVVDIW